MSSFRQSCNTLYLGGSAWPRSSAAVDGFAAYAGVVAAGFRTHDLREVASGSLELTILTPG